MPGLSYLLEDLEKEIRDTAEDDTPFRPPFVKIEAVYRGTREIEDTASITGMRNVGLVRRTNGHTVTGFGMASLKELDAGEGAFIVRTEATGPGLRVRTLSVTVTSDTGAEFVYGTGSSREEKDDNT